MMMTSQNMILKYLRQEYPITTNRWQIIIPISLFVSFFMLIFQPFGLDEYQGKYQVLLLAGYGFVTLVFLSLTFFFFLLSSLVLFRKKDGL